MEFCLEAGGDFEWMFGESGKLSDGDDVICTEGAGVEDRDGGKEERRGVERLRCGTGGGGIDCVEEEEGPARLEGVISVFALCKSSGCMIPLLALFFS
jgi:hypothetical protein